MYLAGHTGLTLGIVSLINRGKVPTSYRKIATVMGLALMPDILDRTAHLVVPGYPDHGVFHSVFFYALAASVVYMFVRKAAPYLAVMVMNVFFDVVNVDPRVFIYPNYGWMNQDYAGQIPPLVDPLMHSLPHWLVSKFAHGHYLIFEVIGGVILIAALIHGVIGGEKIIYLPKRSNLRSEGLIEEE